LSSEEGPPSTKSYRWKRRAS